jgi:hypothetical protein
MTSWDRPTIHISISTAASRSGLARRTVLECLARSLVTEPLTEADLIELRRIRRLQELGVDLPGIEIILRMRRRIQALQTEVYRLEQMWGWQSYIEIEDTPGTAHLAPWQRLLSWESSTD